MDPRPSTLRRRVPTWRLSRCARGAVLPVACLALLLACADDDPDAEPAPNPSSPTVRLGQPVRPPPLPDAGNGGAGVGGAGDGVIGDPTNAPPIAAFVFEPQCVDDFESTITLASTSFDPDGDSLRCTFTMSTGLPPTSEACRVDVLFAITSPQPVTLEVRDGRGGVDSVTQEIEPCPGVF